MNTIRFGLLLSVSLSLIACAGTQETTSPPANSNPTFQNAIGINVVGKEDGDFSFDISQELTLASTTGFRWVRIPVDFGETVNATERSRQLAVLNQRITTLRSLNIRPILTIGTWNNQPPDYFPRWPKAPAKQDEFAAYVVEILRQNGNIHFAISNEPNREQGMTLADVPAYVEVVRKVRIAQQAASLPGTLIGLTVSTNDGSDANSTALEFTRAAVAAGLLNYVDGVAINLYPDAGNYANWQPEQLIPIVNEFKALTNNKPLYILELGAPTAAVSQQQQSILIQRSLLAYASLNPVAMVPYELRDRRNSVRDEASFGFFDINRQPKQSANDLARLLRRIGNSQFVRLESPAVNRRQAIFEDSFGIQIHVRWTTSGTPTPEFPANPVESLP